MTYVLSREYHNKINEIKNLRNFEDRSFTSTDESLSSATDESFELRAKKRIDRIEYIRTGASMVSSHPFIDDVLKSNRRRKKHDRENINEILEDIAGRVLENISIAITSVNEGTSRPNARDYQGVLKFAINKIPVVGSIVGFFADQFFDYSSKKRAKDLGRILDHNDPAISNKINDLIGILNSKPGARKIRTEDQALDFIEEKLPEILDKAIKSSKNKGIGGR